MSNQSYLYNKEVFYNDALIAIKNSSAVSFSNLIMKNNYVFYQGIVLIDTITSSFTDSNSVYTANAAVSGGVFFIANTVGRFHNVTFDKNYA